MPPSPAPACPGMNAIWETVLGLQTHREPSSNPGVIERLGPEGLGIASEGLGILASEMQALLAVAV